MQSSLKFRFGEPVEVLGLPVGLGADGDVDDAGAVGDGARLRQRRRDVLHRAAEVPGGPEHLHHLLVSHFAAERCGWSAATKVILFTGRF